MNVRTILISLLIGYVFGILLPADLVSLRMTGKNASHVGTTGNPGMANIMAHLGFKAGLIVLAGDLLKCAIALLIARLIFRDPQKADLLFAGLGCTLGHDFPAWRGFRGGKGVTVSCLALVVYHPLWGLVAVLSGMIVVFITKYLCIAGIAIPVVFSVIMAVCGNVPALIVGCIHVLLSVWCNRRSLRGIRDGSTGKNDVLGALRRKFSRKKN